MRYALSYLMHIMNILLKTAPEDKLKVMKKALRKAAEKLSLAKPGQLITEGKPHLICL